jgi:P4 family phage/plasmid primase-like protien
VNDSETSDLRRRFGKDRLLQLMQAEGLRRRGVKTECPARCSPGRPGAAFDPSCSVFEGDAGEGAWKCHRCELGGDVFNLAQALTGASGFAEAVRWVQEKDGAPLPPLRGRPAAKPPESAAALFAALAEDDGQVRTYLRTRGLELALDRGLVRCNVGGSAYWWLSGKARAGYRMAVALWSASGELHSLQLRQVTPQGDPKKAKLNLAGVEFPADKLVIGAAAEAKVAARVYLAAGATDTLAVLLAGVVAVGTPGDGNISFLVAHLGDVRGREFVLCPQNDRIHSPRAKVKCEAHFAALQVELLALGAEVRVLPTPEAHKDPAAWLEAVGLDEFTRAVREDLVSEEVAGGARVPGEDDGDEDDEWGGDSDEDPGVEEEPAAAAGSAQPQPSRAAGVTRLRLRFQLTDTGNAERMVAQHGETLRYCHTWGAWLVWDGRRWQRDATSEVMRLAKATVRSMKREFDEEAARRKRDPLLQQRDDYLAGLGDFARKCESADKRRAMVSMAAVEQRVSIEADQLDGDSWLLNVANGTLDLRTGELRPHARGDLLTRVVPVEHDPGAECPRWLRFLSEIFVGDEDLIGFIQRAVGYSLTGETGEQVFFLCYGTGANGKSRFFEILELLAGEYAMVADFDTFASADAAPGAPRPDLVRLRGARVVTAAEPDRRIQLSESRLKLVTGEDVVVARSLHEREQAFRPVLKLWLMANHKPSVAESNHGFWRRVKLVPFRHTVPEEQRDPELKQKLRAELPGILRWALDGCRAWQRERLGQPAAIAAAVQEYREEMDQVGRFLADCCFLHENARVRSKDIYDSYKRWCADGGEHSFAQKKFSPQLEERGFKKAEKNFGAEFQGLGLLTDRTPIQNNLPEVG